jgi:ubiquinone/menaquinone biosynthesis C-methylase UbiE
VIKAIDLRGVKKALDLGGGPGTYSRELAGKGIAVTLFDVPNTINIAREIMAGSKGKNVDFLSGDFHADPIGSGYDLVFVSQIFHAYSADDNRVLLTKAREALNPKGRIAVQEFLLEKDRAHPVPGALFSVNMLVNTAEGRCYTQQEMKQWLAQTGFKAIKAKVLGDTIVLTGRKG